MMNPGDGVLTSSGLPGIVRAAFVREYDRRTVYAVEHYAGQTRIYEWDDLVPFPASGVHAFNMRVHANYEIMLKFHDKGVPFYGPTQTA